MCILYMLYMIYKYVQRFICIYVCLYTYNTFVFFSYILTGLETSIFFGNDVAC